MNCRRVNSLLSAYLDSELTGAEMLAVREHLRGCISCREEHETLYETKRLVASLAFRAPRAELESLLMSEAARASQAGFGGMASRFLSWLSGDSGATTPASFAAAPLYLRPRPLAATALLSIAGLWLASVSLDAPNDVEGVLPPAPGATTFEAGSVSTSPSFGSGGTLASSPTFAPVAVAWAGSAPGMVSGPYATPSYSSNLTPIAVSSVTPLPGNGAIPAAIQGGWAGSSMASFGPGTAALLSAARRLASH